MKTTDSSIALLFEVAKGNERAREIIVERFEKSVEAVPPALSAFLRRSSAPVQDTDVPIQPRPK